MELISADSLKKNNEKSAELIPEDGRAYLSFTSEQDNDSLSNKSYDVEQNAGGQARLSSDSDRDFDGPVHRSPEDAGGQARLSSDSDRDSDGLSNKSYDVEQNVGGQALIEGVMMRAKGTIAMAIRRRNGEIFVKKEPFHSLTERYPLLKLPVLRGGIGLIEMLIVGIRALNLSAEIAIEDLENGENRKVDKKKSSVPLILTMVIAVLIGVAVFFVGPLSIATYFFDVEANVIAFNLLTGGIRIIFLVGYIALIGTSKELQRVFQYHGAEHKSVFTYEAKADLTPQSALRYSRFHPRCGTSFLFIVMITAIAFFSIFDGVLILLFGFISLPVRLLTHLPLIPVLAGVSYEFIKLSAKHRTTTIGRMIIAPGLWLQRITTREPDELQVETALAALTAAIGEDGTLLLKSRIPDANGTRERGENVSPSTLSVGMTQRTR